MRRLLLVCMLVTAVMPDSATAQQSQSVPIEFLSGGGYVRGRFFESLAEEPMATLVLIPGWPVNPSDVIGLGILLAQLNVNMLMFNPRGPLSTRKTPSDRDKTCVCRFRLLVDPYN